MREAGIPLYGLESRHPLADFDVLGFSLPYEQLYTNVLTTLDLAGIPLRAAERTDEPLVIAGGSACLNPEPMHAFFDAFFIGEGEDAITEIVRTWTDARREDLSRADALAALARIEGVYVPSHWQVSYQDDGRIQTMDHGPWTIPIVHRPSAIGHRPSSSSASSPPCPRRRPSSSYPSSTSSITGRLSRSSAGVRAGCRFCQAGMVFRPVRERPLDEVLAAVDAVMRDTGFEEISFLSLSSSDYSRIGELVGEVVARHGDEKLSIGLPSLRIETFSAELMDKLEKGRRRSGFTFAPEAATDRLRDVINKPIATEALLDAAREVYRRGWTTIKLYFMIGHPTQTLEDVQAIADLAHAVRQASASRSWAASRASVWG